MGFVAMPALPASHRVVELGTSALARLAHRGGMDSDGKSGDGAGLLIQVPHRLLGGRPSRLAVAMLFEWDSRARVLLAEELRHAGSPISEWRQVPVDRSALGEKALEGAPEIWQGLIDNPQLAPDEWEDLLYRARRAAERRAAAEGVRMYLPSLSSRTLVFKGLMAGTHLADFYLDLRDPDCESALAVFHQRYSTNTMPDWRNAQPFRMLAHNGEINTLSGNRNWMRAREPYLPEELHDVVWQEGSDSASLDNVLELLVRLGSDPAEALMTLVPDAWEGRGDLDPSVRDFYRFQSTRYEPWDGPAALAFSDGIVAGAALDRNGLRPLRYQVTDDGLVVAASEAGVVPLDPAHVIERGRLGPGELILVDTSDGSILRDADAKERVAARQEYGNHADRLLHPVPRKWIDSDAVELLPGLQRVHGWGNEDVKIVVKAMAETGLEAVYSMGDDTPIAILGRTHRRVYNYLRQRFAQVTNPPIDSLRERFVMSLRVVLGPRVSMTGVPPRKPAPPPLLELESPILGAGELKRILETGLVLDATFGEAETLREALERLCDAADAAEDGILVLSDRSTSRSRLPVPMLLAVGAVHERLLQRGTRFRKDIVALAGDAVDVHDVAMLVSTGAAAVHPYLGFATARTVLEDVEPVDAENAYRKALESGLLKVMAKMGISCVASYCGAQVFEALGLGAEVMEVCLPDVASRVGGADFADLEAVIREHHAAAWTANETPPDLGLVRFRKAGEWHAHNPVAVRQLQKAARSGDAAEYATYQQLADMGRPAALRNLLDFRRAAEPVELSEVEPVEAILPRFIATAMSLGALSPEAHLALGLAMNSIGARSNSGEGGEDPDLYTAEGVRGDNRIKQVASARFGVTARYLLRADELEIKMAQGSKPGEGGQLPGIKVTSTIARLRHAQAGQQLISPPPHHDIYSIEDLAQLIYDLKAINPRARVGVKLVSEAGVGTIAAGVAKARADYVLISGHDGGTGASPLSSIKGAGVPWEMGLAETQQVLVANRLRERLTVRTDGGLRTGADIVKAALLGAEEFGMGTMLLVALGCDMARQCHLNTCPTGIATQREDLRAKFEGRPEHVVNYLTLLAEEVRGILASLGARGIDEIVGHVELLEQVPGSRLDLDYVLRAPAAGHPLRRLWPRNGDPAPLDPPSGPIDNSNRTLGASLSRLAVETGETSIREYQGSAGQSFGAWLSDGVELTLRGEANDYIGKGMSGGVIAIRPYEHDAAKHPVLAGNTCLYGATGGRLFIAGRGGERFCVRNSGAVAVVEGVGDHFCEYMTGGVAVALGEVGSNVGAGMTGGVAYIREWLGLNPDSVVARAVPREDAEELRMLITEHAARTGSRFALELLSDWRSALAGFRQVVPVARLQAPADSVDNPQVGDRVLEGERGR
jgi:glutamate synthase domain-containing protein 2/glutamate synthase domain-containing protein 1/glutamate synthase domain-containing protein 3